MKKIALSIGVVLVAVLLSACTQKGPEEVVKKYYTHLCKGEFDKIQDCVSEEHHSFYSWCNVIQTVEEKRAKAKEKIEITDIQCNIIGSEAICSCLLKIGDEPLQKEVVKLKKVGNAWLVDQGEESLIPTGEELPIMEMDEDEDYGKPADIVEENEDGE